MKLGFYLLKPAVFTQKEEPHSLSMVLALPSERRGSYVNQYPVCCPLPSAALFTALPLGADTVDVASNIDNINRAALCEISAAGIVSAGVVQAMPIHREHFVVVDGCYPCDMRCLIGRDLGVKTLHFFVFSPCNPAAAVIQYEQPPLWLVVIGSLLALIGV